MKEDKPIICGCCNQQLKKRTQTYKNGKSYTYFKRGYVNGLAVCTVCYARWKRTGSLEYRERPSKEEVKARRREYDRKRSYDKYRQCRDTLIYLRKERKERLIKMKPDELLEIVGYKKGKVE